MPMKRATIAAITIAGATIPAVVATLFLFGCCVLPFHHVIHKLMPICSMAAGFMRGDQPGPEETQPAKAVEKESLKRLATEVPSVFRLTVVRATGSSGSHSAATGYRSFISLGASRFDQDVGAYLVLETFLI